MKTATLFKLNGINKIKVKFDFDFADLERVRSIKNRAWFAQEKYWTVPFSFENITLLDSWNFSLDNALTNHIKSSVIPISSKIDLTHFNIPGLNGILREFQKEGICLIDQKIQISQKGVLLADDMGLGKTIETLGWLQSHPEYTPIICIVPASVKLNWKREAERWMENPIIQILSGTQGHSLKNSKANIFILNYDILVNWVSFINEIQPQVIIFDECHKIKNNKAIRTKKAINLAKSIPHVLCLSGTPIENRPIEIYNAWRITDPSNCPNYWHFGQRYCGAKHNGFGWTFNGATNTKELHELLIKSVMIRRLKKDVLTELPDKVYTFLPFEIDNQIEYDFAEKEFISFVKHKVEVDLREKFKSIMLDDFPLIEFNDHKLNTLKENAAEKASHAEVLAQIEMLKQLAVKGKLKQAIEWISDFLESDQKLVVFAHHKFVIAKLMQAFGNIAKKIDGSVSISDRQIAIDTFQTSNKTKLCIISEAGGEGITLTAASNIAILEYPWTPGKLDQIIARLDRIGQKNAVTIHYMLATGTIDEKIANLLDEKRKTISAVLDGKDVDRTNLISELINQYTTI
jgi:SWI/SNF-related matrix-associated actin-dependent regulator 1 of chromatin subfamily A